MIRPFRDEKDRYGHYSIAEESMYDHTYQWVPSVLVRTWLVSVASTPMNGIANT